MIGKAGRWSDTVCLRRTSSAAGSGQESLGAFSNARCIDYSKSWTRALPRLVISLPLILSLAIKGTNFIFRPAYPLGVISLLVSYVVLIGVAVSSYSIFWHPAVSRKAKIELRKVLRAGNQSGNERPDSITILAWIMLFFGASFFLISIFTINNPEVRAWISKNPISGPIQCLVPLADAIISIVAAIFIMRGANWGRLLYIWWGAFYFVIELLALRTKGMTLTLIFGALYLIFVLFLLRPKASAYFASHNRVKTS